MQSGGVATQVGSDYGRRFDPCLCYKIRHFNFNPVFSHAEPFPDGGGEM